MVSSLGTFSSMTASYRLKLLDSSHSHKAHLSVCCFDVISFSVVRIARFVGVNVSPQ